MTIRSTLTTLVVLLPLGAGCSNACESLCVRMADYAEECGFIVLESEITECIDAQNAAPIEDLEACKSFNDPLALRREWSCEDMELYWDQGKED